MLIAAKPQKIPSNEDLPESLTVLQFTTQGILFGIPLDYVERCVLLMELRPVPGGPDHLVGLLDLHGRGLPVIDLGILVGLQQVQNYNLDTPVIFCGEDDRQVGLVVSEVNGVETYTSEAVQSRIDFEGGIEFVSAALNGSAGLCLLLNVERILTVDLGSNAREVRA